MFKAGNVAALAAASLVALAVWAPLAGAGDQRAFTLAISSPFSFVVVDPCTGQPVLVQGTEHDLFHATTPMVGTMFESHDTFVTTGTGTAILGGGGKGGGDLILAPEADYVVTGTHNESGFQNLDDGTLVYTATDSFNVIHKGETAPGGAEDDFRVEGVMHVTVTPTGEQTATVDVVNATCGYVSPK